MAMNPMFGLLGITAPSAPSPFGPPALGRGGAFARPFPPAGGPIPGSAASLGGTPIPMPAQMPGPLVGYNRRERRQQQKLPPMSPFGPGGPLAQKMGLG